MTMEDLSIKASSSATEYSVKKIMWHMFENEQYVSKNIIAYRNCRL